MQEFIRNRGVTTCPSFGTPEFRDLNIAREIARAEQFTGSRWANNRKAALRKALRK